jgi:acetylornithine deacetylase/succinyl-diaminopimelate desuccinylase-like protein
MKDVVELLLDLVRIPSVSSITNQPVIDYATAALDPRVWTFHCDRDQDAAGTPTTNLVALHEKRATDVPSWRSSATPILCRTTRNGRRQCIRPSTTIASTAAEVAT